MFIQFILNHVTVLKNTDVTVNQTVIPIFSDQSHLPMSNLCLKPNTYPWFSTDKARAVQREVIILSPMLVADKSLITPKGKMTGMALPDS